MLSRRLLIECDETVIKTEQNGQHKWIKTGMDRDRLKREYAEFFERQTLGYLVRRTIALMSRRLNDALAEYQITLNHWVVLACLWQKNGLPVMYLGDQLQHIGGSVSDLLTRMEKRKLLKRRRDKKDRRIWRVYLTEEGEQLADVLPPIVFRCWNEAWADLTQEELSEFSGLIDRMIANCEPEYCVCLPEQSGRFAENYQFILPPRSPGFRLKLLQLLITRRYTDAVEHLNVTSSHTLVLCRLWQDDGVPVSEVGQYVEQVGGSLTGVLERMEERGLITRTQCGKDKRCSRVWLTEEGLNLMEVLPPISRTVLQEITAGLTEQQTTFFKKCLNKMLNRMLSKESPANAGN